MTTLKDWFPLPVGVTTHSIPLPATAEKLVTRASTLTSVSFRCCSGSIKPSWTLPSLAMALPIGCSELLSAAATSLQNPFFISVDRVHCEAICTPPSVVATVILPTVNVPVLSNTTLVIRVACSSVAPPLIRIPFVAPTPVPTITAVGVDKPNAHGHATTITEIHNCKHNMIFAVSSPPPSILNIPGNFPAGKTCDNTIQIMNVNTP